MTRSTHWFVPLLAFSLISVINPGYFSGCTSSVPDNKFEYGEADLLELLDEANATSPFDLNRGQERFRLEVSLAQQSGEDEENASASLQPSTPLYARAFACGNRRFMQSASACTSYTEVPLIARFTLYRMDASGATAVIPDHELAGELRVVGKHLTNGQITLRSMTDGTRIELASRDGKQFALSHFSTVVDGVFAAF